MFVGVWHGHAQNKFRIFHCVILNPCSLPSGPGSIGPRCRLNPGAPLQRKARKVECEGTGVCRVAHYASGIPGFFPRNTWPGFSLHSPRSRDSSSLWIRPAAGPGCLTDDGGDDIKHSELDARPFIFPRRTLTELGTHVGVGQTQSLLLLPASTYRRQVPPLTRPAPTSPARLARSGPCVTVLRLLLPTATTMSDTAAASAVPGHIDLELPRPGTASSMPPYLREAEPHHYRRIDVLGTAPASARTSFTKVNETRPGSVSEAEGVVDVNTQGEGQEGETEQEQEQAQEAVPQTPKCSITFLLVSGKRRQMSFEPETTVGRVKELVWNAWPNDSEWNDERPPAPSFLRILHLGKILQDDDTLAKLNFPASTPSSSGEQVPSTIVHLSIRPYAQPSEDETLKKKGRRRRRGTDTTSGDGAEGEDDGAGCCRCIIC